MAVEDALIAINFYVGGISIIPIIQRLKNYCQYFTKTCMTLLLQGIAIIVIKASIYVN